MYQFNYLDYEGSNNIEGCLSHRIRKVDSFVEGDQNIQ
jgi:hypothetical protein